VPSYSPLLDDRFTGFRPNKPKAGLLGTLGFTLHPGQNQLPVASTRLPVKSDVRNPAALLGTGY
jgi:hypothetical protein